MIGVRFGRLVVLARHPKNNSGGNEMFDCICDCGRERVAVGTALRRGITYTCGCGRLPGGESINRTHGQSKRPEYSVWKAMRQRCSNIHSPDYPNYGGRGITVCERWNSSFENFIADIGSIPPGMSLDRIDNNQGYSPENCRLTTNAVQGRNKRTNKLLTYNGETKPLVDWSIETGICAETISRRVDNGWSVEDALTVKPKPGGHHAFKRQGKSAAL